MRFFLQSGILSVIYLLGSAQVALCASAARSVKEGNAAYHRKQFDAAIEAYKRAAALNSGSGIVNFDLGAANYKKGDYAAAVDYFTRCLVEGEPALEAAASYNIANSKYRQAETKERLNLQEAISAYEEALSYYKRAIELNSEDIDAKANYELTVQKIELLKEQLKQQNQQEQQKQKPEPEQNKESPESEGSQRPEEGEKESQPESGGVKPQEDEEQKDDSQPQGSSPEPEETEEMTEEEAKALLEGFRQEEASAQEDQHKKIRAYPEVLKDW